MSAARGLGGVALALIGALALVGALGCQAQVDDFYAKIWFCKANTDSCGTTQSGKPMTCFEASQLGGDDFCTEACDFAQGSTDPRFYCTTSGALLQRCGPERGLTDPAFACPSGLSCYRTDLVTDEGLCIQMTVCSDDSDCNDVRPTCATTLLQQRTSLQLATGNLQCVVNMCATGQCPAGEVCLAGFFDTAVGNDLCVPTCDENKLCPPNYACAAPPKSSGSPSLCLPGVPGIRCNDNQDCLTGDCLDAGGGFNECVVTWLACNEDKDCKLLDGASSTFLCVESVPGGGKHCILKEEFSGTNCELATDCPDGFICTHIGPYAPSMTHGECRLPCGADLGCPVRGGIQHVCLQGGEGGCYPTTFGLPCASGADCRMPELDCLPVLPDEHTVIDSPTICTMPCTTDADCEANPLIRGDTFCRQDEHLCRLAGYAGTPCDNGKQCLSAVCASDGTCAD
jgi:hypothetical protein